jgi:hypothetical protein
MERVKGRLNEQAIALIEAIGNAGGTDMYVSRSAIAKALGKPRLSASDTAVLDLLASLGFIDRGEQETNAPSGYKIVYRVTPEQLIYIASN